MPYKNDGSLDDYQAYADNTLNKPTQLGSATDAMQSGMYSGLEFAAREAGFDSVSDWAKAKATKNLAESQEYIPSGPQRVEEIGKHGSYVGDALDYAKNTAINQVPVLGTMLGAGAAGALVAGPVGALAAAAGSTAPMHLGEAYNRQKEEGVDDPNKVWGAAGINTAMDVIPVGTFINTARKLGGGTFAKAVAKGAAAEGTTEAAQGVVTDYAAGINPSMEEDYVMDRVNEAVAGAMLGGGMTGAGHAVGAAAHLPGEAYDTLRDADFDPMQGIKKATGYQEVDDSPFQHGESTQKNKNSGQSADLEINAVRNQLAREGWIYPEQEEWLLNNYEQSDIENILDLSYGQTSEKASNEHLDDLAVSIINGETSESEVSNLFLNSMERAYLDDAVITLSEQGRTPAQEQAQINRRDEDKVYDEAVAQEEVNPYLETETNELQFKDTKDEDTGETKETPDAYVDPDAGYSVNNMRIGKLNNRGEKWDKDDYLLNAEKAKPYRTKTHKKDFTSSNELIDKLNTSKKREYKKISLQEGIENDVRREMRRESNFDKNPEELNTKIITFDEQGNPIVTEVPNVTLSVDERIAARKAEVAKDIMDTRTNNKSDFYKELTKLYDDGKNPDAVLDLYDSIESRQQSDAVKSGNQEFDYQDKQRIEVKPKESKNPKEDTTKVSQGFVPLKPNAEGEYKRLDMVKAVKERKKELEYSENYTDVTDKQVTAEAVKSVLSEYMDKIDLTDKSIAVERKARTEVIPRFSESPKLRTIHKIVERIQNGDSMLTKLPGRDTKGKPVMLDMLKELDFTKGDSKNTAKNLFNKLNLTSTLKNKKYTSAVADTESEARQVIDEVAMENMLAEVGVSAKFVESIYKNKYDYQVSPAEEFLSLTPEEQGKAKNESLRIQLGNLDKQLDKINKNKNKNWKLLDWEQLKYVGKDDQNKSVFTRDNTRLISDEEYSGNTAKLQELKDQFKDYPQLEQELKDRAEWEKNKAYRKSVNEKANRIEAQIKKKEKDLAGYGIELENIIAKQNEADIKKAESFDKGEFDYREDMEDIAADENTGKEGGYTSVVKADQVEKNFNAGSALKQARDKVSYLTKEMTKAVKTKDKKLIATALKNLNNAKKQRDKLTGKSVGMSADINTNLDSKSNSTQWQRFVVNGNLKDSVSAILDESTEGATQHITKRVYSLLKDDTKIKMFSELTETEKVNNNVNDGRLGFYTPYDNMAAVDDTAGKLGPRVILHEAIHAVTYNALESYAQGKPVSKRIQTFGKEIEAIQAKMKEFYASNKEAIEDFGGHFDYSTKNIHEFMAVALTDKKVMALMKQIPYQRKTLVNKFADSIRKFLGLSAKDQNALNAMIDISGEVFNEVKYLDSFNKQFELGDRLPGIPTDMEGYLDGVAAPGKTLQELRDERDALYKQMPLHQRKDPEIFQVLLDKVNKVKEDIKNFGVEAKSQTKPEIKSETKSETKFIHLKNILEGEKTGIESKYKNVPKNEHVEKKNIDDILESSTSPTLTMKSEAKVKAKTKADDSIPFDDVDYIRVNKESKTAKPRLSKSFTQKFGKVSKSNVTTAQTQKLADNYLKNLGIKAKIIDGAAALKEAKKLGIDDAEFGMKFGSLHGFANATPNADGSYNVYINPAMQGALRNEILEHELGHVIMYGSALNPSNKEASSVLKEYTSWLNKRGKDSDLVTDLIKSKKSPEAALLYMQQMGSGLTIKDIDGNLKDYILDFGEWFADQAGKALARNTAPRTTVQKFFNRLIKTLKKVFGVDDKVETFIDGIRAKHQVSQPGNLTPELVALSKSFTKDITKSSAFRKMEDTFKNVLGDKDYNLRRLAGGHIDAFNDLADLMFKPRGKTTTDNSYWHNKLLYLAKYDTRATDIMRGATREVQDKVMQQLYNENLPDSSALQRTVKIRNLLKNLKDYMEKEGITVPTRKNYFPNIVDQDYTAEHHDEFTAMMKKYPKEMKGIADKWNKDTESKARFKHRQVDPNDLVTFRDIPEMLYTNIVRGDLMDEATSEGQQTPHVRFLKHRVIDFLKGQDKVVWKNSYLQHSVTDATATYIMQVVKRVEYAKRFGKLNDNEKMQYVNKKMHDGGKTVYSQDEIDTFDKEADWTNRLEVLLDRAREEGATDAEIQHARDYVAAEMGTYGRNTATWLNEKLGIPMPQSHAPINTDLQKATSAVMSIANVWVLGLSTITSLLDPIGIAVRSGSATQALSSMVQGIKSAVGKDRSELEIMAEAVGSISDVATKEALAHGYNMINMTPTIKNINDKFFKLIGLEQWTKTTRLMAVDAAQGFIKRHDTKPNKHSERFLKELGLQSGDIKYSTNGKVKVLTYEQYQSATESEQQRDDRIKSAIAEFVDTSILRPSPSQRPAWASDPHFALLFHLKSFMYSFQKTIINPSWKEIKEHGNLAPLIAMGMYVPAGIAVGLIKDMFKTFGDDEDDWTPDYKENWGIGDYMLDGVEKSGLTGITQPIFDARRSSEFGGSWVGGLFGPALEPWDTFNGLPLPLNYTWNNLTN